MAYLYLKSTAKRSIELEDGGDIEPPRRYGDGTMSRKELPEHLRKASLRITVDPDVAATAQESGNASAWFNEAAKRYVRALAREKAEGKFRREKKS